MLLSRSLQLREDLRESHFHLLFQKDQTCDRCPPPKPIPLPTQPTEKDKEERTNQVTPHATGSSTGEKTPPRLFINEQERLNSTNRSYAMWGCAQFTINYSHLSQVIARPYFIGKRSQ